MSINSPPINVRIMQSGTKLIHLKLIRGETRRNRKYLISFAFPLSLSASLQSMAELDEISRVQREIFGVNRVQVGV